MNSGDNFPPLFYALFALLFFVFAMFSLYTGRTLRSSRFAAYTRRDTPIRYYATVLMELIFALVGVYGFVQGLHG